VDPEEIRNRIVQKALQDKQNKEMKQEECKSALHKKNNEEAIGFKEAKESLCTILRDLPVKDNVKITVSELSVLIQKSDAVGGGSDEYKYFFDTDVAKLCCFHRKKFGVYYDDYGRTSYDHSDPSRNRIDTTTHFETLSELLHNFEATIPKFVSI